MFYFIFKNPLLILGIAGGSIAFLASITKAVSSRRKTRYVLILSGLGFLILIGRQLVVYNQNQSRTILEKSRQKLIEDIKDNVIKARFTIEQVAEKLRAVSLNTLGSEFATIDSEVGENGFVEFEAFGKGSPEMWETYANWLNGKRQIQANPSLFLTLNAGNHYNMGLLLAYLLTNEESRTAIKDIMEKGKERGPIVWNKFPSDEFIKQFVEIKGNMWILFFDRGFNNLVAYADAQSFVKELLLYRSLGQSDTIMTLLNTRDPNISKALSEKFTSVKTLVVRDSDTKTIIRTMIDKQVSELAVVEGQKRYIVYLERIIKLAAESS